MRRAFLGLIALILAVATAGCSGGGSDREGEVQMPASSSAYVGEHFEVAVEELESAGFTNVQTKALGDLITGWLNDDGEVEKIRVDGSNNFSKGAWFPADMKILITFHSFPEEEAQEKKSQEKKAQEKKSQEEKSQEKKVQEEHNSEISPTPETTPQVAPTGPTDAERSKALDQRLREIFGVSSMTELLVEMPSDWPGYVAGVRVEGDLAYFTLQVDRNTADGARLGKEAAQALSTLLGEEDVIGINWIIVEDGTGVVIDQKQPNPNY